MTRAALAPLPALLLLAACGGDDESQTWAVEPPPYPEVVMIRRLQPEDGGAAALLRGTLVVRDGCLRVQGQGEESWLVLWPAEARLSVAAAHDVSVDGDPGKGQQMVRVGEPVEIGGGELTGDDALARIGPGRPIATSAAVPAACPGPVWIASAFGPQDGGA